MVSWLKGMNGSPTPPTYGFCVPPPGRLVFLLANKVKPVFIFFQTLDIAYTAHWIGFIIQISSSVYCFRHTLEPGACQSQSWKWTLRELYVVRTFNVVRAQSTLVKAPGAGRRAFLYTAGGHFPWNLNIMFKSKIIRILGNSQFWAFYVHFEDG